MSEEQSYVFLMDLQANVGQFMAQINATLSEIEELRSAMDKNKKIKVDAGELTKLDKTLYQTKSSIEKLSKLNPINIDTGASIKNLEALQEEIVKTNALSSESKPMNITATLARRRNRKLAAKEGVDPGTLDVMRKYNKSTIDSILSSKQLSAETLKIKGIISEIGNSSKMTAETFRMSFGDIEQRLSYLGKKEQQNILKTMGLWGKYEETINMINAEKGRGGSKGGEISDSGIINLRKNLENFGNTSKQVFDLHKRRLAETANAQTEVVSKDLNLRGFSEANINDKNIKNIVKMRDVFNRFKTDVTSAAGIKNTFGSITDSLNKMGNIPDKLSKSLGISAPLKRVNELQKNIQDSFVKTGVYSEQSLINLKSQSKELIGLFETNYSKIADRVKQYEKISQKIDTAAPTTKILNSVKKIDDFKFSGNMINNLMRIGKQFRLLKEVSANGDVFAESLGSIKHTLDNLQTAGPQALLKKIGVGSSLPKLRKEIDSVVDSVNKGGKINIKDFERLRVQLNNVARASINMEEAIKRGTDSAGKTIADFSSRNVTVLGRLVTTFKNVVGYVAILSLFKAVSTVAKVATTDLIKFNDALVEVRKVSDPRTINIGALSSDIHALSNELRVLPQETADMVKTFVQQGLSQQNALSRTREAILLNKVALLDYGTAVNFVTAMTKTFAKNQGDLRNISDKLLLVQAKHAITTRDLADAVLTVASVSDKAGVSFNRLTGYITAVKVVSRKTGKEVGTAFKTIFARMKKNKFNELVESLANIKTHKSNGELRNLGDVLDDLSAKWNTLNGDQKQNIALAAGGRRRYNDVLILMDNYNEALQTMAEQTHAAGLTNDLLTVTFAKVSEKIAGVKSNISSLIQGISASTAMPALSGLLSTINLIVDGANKLGRFVSSILGPTLTKFAGGFVSVTGAIMGTVFALGLLKTSLVSLGIAATAKKIGAFIGALTAPELAAIVAVIGTLTAAFIYFGDQSDVAGEKIKKINDAIALSGDKYKQTKLTLDNYANRLNALNVDIFNTIDAEEERTRIVEGLKRLMPDYSAEIDGVRDSTQGLLEVTKALNAAEKEKRRNELSTYLTTGIVDQTSALQKSLSNPSNSLKKELFREDLNQIEKVTQESIQKTLDKLQKITKLRDDLLIRLNEANRLGATENKAAISAYLKTLHFGYQEALNDLVNFKNLLKNTTAPELTTQERGFISQKELLKIDRERLTLIEKMKTSLSGLNSVLGLIPSKTRGMAIEAIAKINNVIHSFDGGVKIKINSTAIKADTFDLLQELASSFSGNPIDVHYNNMGEELMAQSMNMFNNLMSFFTAHTIPVILQPVLGGFNFSKTGNTILNQVKSYLSKTSIGRLTSTYFKNINAEQEKDVTALPFNQNLSAIQKTISNFKKELPKASFDEQQSIAKALKIAVDTLHTMQKTKKNLNEQQALADALRKQAEVKRGTEEGILKATREKTELEKRNRTLIQNGLKTEEQARIESVRAQTKIEQAKSNQRKEDIKGVYELAKAQAKLDTTGVKDTRILARKNFDIDRKYLDQRLAIHSITQKDYDLELKKLKINRDIAIKSYKPSKSGRNKDSFKDTSYREEQNKINESYKLQQMLVNAVGKSSAVSYQLQLKKNEALIGALQARIAIKKAHSQDVQMDISNLNIAVEKQANLAKERDIAIQIEAVNKHINDIQKEASFNIRQINDNYSIVNDLLTASGASQKTLLDYQIKQKEAVKATTQEQIKKVRAELLSLNIAKKMGKDVESKLLLSNGELNSLLDNIKNIDADISTLQTKEEILPIKKSLKQMQELRSSVSGVFSSWLSNLPNSIIEGREKRADAEGKINDLLEKRRTIEVDMNKALYGGHASEYNSLAENWRSVSKEISKSRADMSKINDETNVWKKLLKDILNNVWGNISKSIADTLMGGLFGGKSSKNGAMTDMINKLVGGNAAQSATNNNITSSLMNAFSNGSASLSKALDSGIGGLVSAAKSFFGTSGSSGGGLLGGLSSILGGVSGSQSKGNSSSIFSSILGGGSMSKGLLGGLLGGLVSKNISSKGGSALAGAATGWLVGGPIGGLIGGLSGLFGHKKRAPEPTVESQAPLAENINTLVSKLNEIYKFNEGVFNPPVDFRMPSLGQGLKVDGTVNVNVKIDGQISDENRESIVSAVQSGIESLTNRTISMSPSIGLNTL